MTFKGVGITGISACVPRNVIRNVELESVMTEQEVKNAIETTGIIERRFANDQTCSSDLCYEAALKLLNEMNIEVKSIDLLIFVSQTPDYHQPATAPILQNRLGLPKTVGSFDINLACSGYVYGLSTAFSYVSQDGINKVLLLVGETFSKIVSLKDRATSLLFGDGASATLIEKNENTGESYFSLGSDGSGESAIKIKAGGYRYPSSNESINEKEYEDGSVRTDEQFFMNGVEVFNFVMREVPKDIMAILKYSNRNLDEIDYIVFHQANKFITDFLAKKLKYSNKKVPYCLDKYGNTGAVSIPLTIVSELKDELSESKKNFILSGYGSGFSWATAFLAINKCYISDVIEI
jgi:3-oxoacyl-[acyl-carrier-protein] synthase-3